MFLNFNKNNGLYIFGVTISLLFLFSCKSKIEKKEIESSFFAITEFNPLTNWKKDTNNLIVNKKDIDKLIYLDYENAMSGFSIPSINQISSGKFEFSFKLKNNGNAPQKFFYKIFYQNESYKFPEYNLKDSTQENEFSNENFYGSWIDSTMKFSATETIPNDGESHTISNSFNIQGNPRNEKRYCADGKNDRWKRNPRVGNYSFLLVVTTEENISKNIIPEYIQDISKMDSGKFINPYFYFLYGKGTKLKNTYAQLFPHQLKVIAKPDLGTGIYVNPNSPNSNDKKYTSDNCGMDSNLYKNAPFEQFIHSINISMKMNNIPVISDILGDNYSKVDYNWNKSFYTKEELIPFLPTVSKTPCATVFSDMVQHKIIIKNPKTEFGKWEKQNVGVVSRHGFTYGKYTIKAKLTELLNKDNVWNGLTNAIWLITQGGGEWNNRRICNKEGYMANYYGGSKDQRVKQSDYSEIDFEILKTVPYCPSYSFPPIKYYDKPDQMNIRSWNLTLADEHLANDGNISVACTNWDLACQDGEKFAAGCQDISYNNQIIEAHRWDKNYRAITEKSYQPDDVVFGSNYYYFQIEWRPTEIIWRIGPEKNKLFVVGYMNNTVTSIPNNQMFMNITQEFHPTKFWPGSPYEQENIPFPKSDYIGEIYEFTIE
ncbi:MAG: hypothetical protein HXX09_07670 [Bacteroidetes bacterium]|nr:hypothetical protein [Bacteroidota bacterium]